MTGLLLAFAVFILLHSVPAMPALRNGAIAMVGRRAYFALYSLVSLLALGWLFTEALNTPYVELWQPARWQAHLTFLLAPLGLFLVLAGLFSRNPYSVTLRAGDEADAIAAYTRHPVLWGFTLWALGHVVVNGDLRSLLLFGGLGLFSIGGFFMLDRRGRKRLGARWREVKNKAPLLPFAAKVRLGFDRPMGLALAITALTTAYLLLGGHAALFGADPLLALTW